MSNWEKTMKEWDDSVPDGIKYLSAEKQVLMRRVRELESENARLKDAQRWRVVANGELPEEDGEYWVWFDDEFTGIKISGYCDYSKQNGWDNTERVTHWMPLPPNPESPNDTQSSTIVYGKEGEE